MGIPSCYSKLHDLTGLWSATGKPVKDGNEAKGYVRGENDYVILTDDDLDAVALDTVKTIDIDKFVPAESIDWVYLEKPHYLVPDDPVGQEAFAVIRDAMASDKVVGVSKLVIGRRERAVVLEPRGEGVVLWTLRFGDEVRPEESYFEDIDEQADPDLVPLVQQLIKQKTAKWSPEMVSDPIQKSLLKIIAEKKKALKPAKKSAKDKAETARPASNVINIMDALRALKPTSKAARTLVESKEVEMHLTDTKVSHEDGGWKVDFIGDDGEYVSVKVTAKDLLCEVDAINRAKSLMVELTAFGTRGGGRSANRYDAMSNGNFDDDGPLPMH